MWCCSREGIASGGWSLGTFRGLLMTLTTLSPKTTSTMAQIAYEMKLARGGVVVESHTVPGPPPTPTPSPPPRPPKEVKVEVRVESPRSPVRCLPIIVSTRKPLAKVVDATSWRDDPDWTATESARLTYHILHRHSAFHANGIGTTGVRRSLGPVGAVCPGLSTSLDS